MRAHERDLIATLGQAPKTQRTALHLRSDMLGCFLERRPLGIELGIAQAPEGTNAIGHAQPVIDRDRRVRRGDSLYRPTGRGGREFRELLSAVTDLFLTREIPRR